MQLKQLIAACPQVRCAAPPEPCVFAVDKDGCQTCTCECNEVFIIRTGHFFTGGVRLGFCPTGASQKIATHPQPASKNVVTLPKQRQKKRGLPTLRALERKKM